MQVSLSYCIVHFFADRVYCHNYNVCRIKLFFTVHEQVVYQWRLRWSSV